jgi:AraC-like DNA-binding protein
MPLMTKSTSRFTPLFGERHQSVLWAVDVRAQEGQVSDPTLLDLPTGHVVYAIPVNAALQWESGGKTTMVVEGSVLVVNTRTSPGSIRLSADSDCLVVGECARRHCRACSSPSDPALCPDYANWSLVWRVRSRSRRGQRLGDQVVAGFRRPAVSGPARAFWFESQFKALLALLSFNPAPEQGEFFCSRQKRLARVRVARAKSKLEARIDESFDLHRLAAEVGCSASYLSRTFSATTGMTLSQYLRKRRIEKAAEMLVTGRYNVSEVAVEVGYHSLSHFSKAFQQEKGCLPSKYEAA